MNKVYENIKHETEVFDASPHRLVQMLLERCVQQILLGRHSMERKDVASKCQAITKAMDIISYLKAMLNREAPEAKELTGKLSDVYAFINKQLLFANMNNEPAYLDDALQKLNIIKSGWDAMGEPK